MPRVLARYRHVFGRGGQRRGDHDLELLAEPAVHRVGLVAQVPDHVHWHRRALDRHRRDVEAAQHVRPQQTWQRRDQRAAAKKGTDTAEARYLGDKAAADAALGKHLIDVELTPRLSEPRQFDSLALEVQHKPKRIWVMAALVAALLLGVGVIAIVATRGDSKPAPTPPPPLVAIETPKPTPTPPIAKVEPPVVETTPPVVVTTVKPTLKPVIKKPTPATKIETPVTKIETPVTKIETPAIRTTKPVPPPVVVYDASAFRTHWQTVGAELKTFSLANGVNTITDLQNEYNAISYMSAAASQESRDAAKKTLEDVRTKLAARKK